jgi:aryl-alcohol dehydrogenase-like predicted oxidoreductase
MRRRTFGGTGMVVSEIGIGCSRLGGVLTPGSSRQEQIAMLQEAVDAGISFFDTADMYSQGQSEVILGQALGRRRSDVVVATKGGYLVPTGQRFIARLKPLARPVVQRLRIPRPLRTAGGIGAMAQDFSPAHLNAAVEASLRRLRTDYIDLYQLHSPTRQVVEEGGYIEALEQLRAQGKILHYGIAADDPADATPFDRHRGIESLQVPFNLVDQRARDLVFGRAVERGVGVIVRSCYVAGLLDERVSESTLRDSTPDWQEVLRLRETARGFGRSALEVALQFSLAAGPTAVTILGMRTRVHLQQNLRLYASPPLSPEELDMLSERPSPPPAADKRAG